MKWTTLEHAVFGALRVRLIGQNVTRVIIGLQNQHISMYDLQVQNQSATVLIGLRDFQKLYQLCRRERVKIRFEAREGFPFIWKNLYRRKSYLIGVVLFIALTMTMSSMIWQISVPGVEEEAAAQVLQTAKECGIYVGAFRAGIGDIETLQDNMLKKMPSLVWVGIQTSGSKIRIEAVQEIPGVQLPTSTPRNIISAKPAVIRKVYAYRGEAKVQPGQVVRPGQILISGSLADNTRQVPAEGKVLAEVWYTSKVVVPMTVTQEGLTGQSVKRDYLSLGPLSVRVWGFKQPQYASFEERDDVTNWHLGTWKLPVQLKRVTLFEAEPIAVAKSLDQAKQSALMIAAQDVRRQMHADGTILGQTVLQPYTAHGNLYETVMTQTEEDIGVPAAMPSH